MSDFEQDLLAFAVLSSTAARCAAEASMAADAYRRAEPDGHGGWLLPSEARRHIERALGTAVVIADLAGELSA